MLADDFLGLVEEKKLGVRLMDDGISWLPTNCGPPCHRLPPKICGKIFNKSATDNFKGLNKKKLVISLHLYFFESFSPHNEINQELQSCCQKDE